MAESLETISRNEALSRFDRSHPPDEPFSYQTEGLVPFVATKLSAYLKEWVAAALDSKISGYPFQVASVVKMIGVERIALACARLTNDMLSIHCLRQGTAEKAYANVLEDEVKGAVLRQDDGDLARQALQTVNRQRISRKARRGVLEARVNTLTHFLYQPIDRVVAIVFGRVAFRYIVDECGVFEKASLMGIGGRWSVYYQADKELLAWLEKRRERSRDDASFYMPTERVPIPWTNMVDGGYHLPELKVRTLVEFKTRNCLEEIGDYAPKVFFDSINALQSVPWRVNEPVRRAMTDLWQNDGCPSLFPRKTDYPVPPFEEGLTPVEAYVRARFKESVLRGNSTNRAQRSQLIRTLFVANEAAQHERFYFPYHADFRGRMYPFCATFSVVAGDPSRGMLEFADARPVTSEKGIRALRVHGANLYGYSKKPFADRERWIFEHEGLILNVADDPYHWIEFWSKAEEPWQFLQFCFQYKEWKRSGMSRCVVMADATANAWQLIALTTLNEALAESVNLTESSAPRDLYQSLADELSARLEKTPTGPMWLEWLGGNVSRSVVKIFVVPYAYGGSLAWMRQRITDWYSDRVTELHEDPFEIDRPKAVSDFYYALKDVLLGRLQAQKDLCSYFSYVGRKVAEQGTPVTWETPDGFLVGQEYNSLKTKTVQLALHGKVSQYMCRYFDEGKMDVKSNASALVVNWIHSIEATVLRLSIAKLRAAGVRDFTTNHDCYGARAEDIDTFRSCVREAMAQIFAENPLAHFNQQISDRYGFDPSAERTVPRGTFDLNRVFKANYFTN